MKMHRFVTAVVCLAAIFSPFVAQAFSISSVTLSPSSSVPQGTQLQMTVDISTPGAPPFLYAPTQVYSNSTGIHVDIFPSSGLLAAIGSLRETVTLGTFPPGTYNYEVVLRPDPNYGQVNWGVRTNRGSFTVGSGSTFIFASDFNSGLPAGTTVFGSAAVESGVLKLTTAMNALQGSFIIDRTVPITAFTATFKMLIGGGNGADGLSFNFAHDLPNDIFGEEGAGTGLTVSFDTFDNGGGEAPAIDAKMGGAVIASVPGSSVFRTGEFVDVRIQVDGDGTLDVFANGTAVFQNLPIGFTARSGRFGFGARTGGLNDNHFIDDLTITTGVPSHPAVISASPRGSFVNPDTAVSIAIQDFGTQVNPASIQLRFNGSAVTPQISKSGNVTAVHYDPPGLLPEGSSNVVSLTFSDNGNPVFTEAFTYGFRVADNFGPNDNFYEVVLVSTPITWPEAKIAAEQRTFSGVKGHLATIGSAEEDMLLERLRQQNRPTIGQNQLWVGGFQSPSTSASNANWFWVNNEGPISGINDGAIYANWHAGEPNDYWGPATENYLAIGLFDAFGWNDDGFLDGGRLGGYIVEYEFGQTGIRRLTLEDPREGQQFVPGETVYLRASLNDTSEGPWRIEFFSGDQRIGESTSGQTFFWLGAWSGQHVIRARATNPQGVVVNSGSATIQVGSDPSTTPVVSIHTDQWRTAEPCPTCLVVPGVLVIRRTAPTNNALTVFLNVDGTATSGLDYEPLPSSITIPAGQHSIQFNLLPKDDQLAEGPEVARVRIAPSSTYVLHCCSDEALIVIHDDEANAPTARLDILSPTNGARLLAGRTVDLSAMAVNLSNEVYNSEFYASGQLIARAHGDITTRPPIAGLPSVHTGYWTNPPVGQHTLTARAQLSLNNWVTSPPVNITIQSPPAPVVRLETWPLENARAPEFCPPNADCAYPSFVVRRTGPTNAELRVYLNYSGTATPGLDYPELPRSVVIPPGRDAAFVMLVPKDDTLIEGSETVVAQLTPLPPIADAPYFPDPSASSATITIVDNDSPTQTVVSIRAEDSIATELPPAVSAIDPARFRISRTGDLARELMVFFSVTGTATAGRDYQELTSPVRIPAGAQSTTLDVRAIYDELTEGVETVLVRLQPSPVLAPVPTYEIDPANVSATVFIRDSSMPEASLTIIRPTNGASFNPGETILIEAVAIDPVDIVYRVEFWDGENRIGVSEIVFDITPAPGTPIHHRFEWRAASHGPHVLTARAVSTDGTALRSAPVSITVGGDPPPLLVRIDATSRIAEETSEPFRRTPLVGVFTISRTGPTNQAAPVFVQYSGMARPGVDYPEQPALVTIPAGAASTEIRIQPIPDQAPEGIETVVATIFQCPPSTDPSLLCATTTPPVDPAHKNATIFIREDGVTDATLAITRPTNGARFNVGETIVIEAVAIDLNGYISYVEVFAGNQRIGVSNIQFIQPPPPGTPIHHRFEWRTAPAGSHVLTARAPRPDDSVIVSQPVNITVGDGSPRPIVRIDATNPIVQEFCAPEDLPNCEDNGIFTISRTGPTTNSLPVYVTYSGSATAGTDYRSLPFVVEIPAGRDSAVISVDPIADNLPEGIETVVARISNCPPPQFDPPCFDFTVDPAHSSATVFIRDRGTTEASLTITRPTNGASFNLGQPIVVEAVAIDMRGYISHVEFFANNQKIGASDVVFIQAPPPGTPVHHRFEWRGAPVGAHVLTARATTESGVAVQSPPITITVQGDPPPGDREVHVVGAYSGTAPGGGLSHNNEQGDAAVTVNRPGKRVTLVLSAYEPVVWHLTIGNATVVDRIILGGYYRQRVEGIGSNVEIIDATFPNHPDNPLYIGYSLDCPDVYRGLAKIRALTGLEISSFHGGYQASYPTPILIDSVQDDPRLRANYPVPTPASQLPNLEFQLSFYHRGGGGDVFTRRYTLAGPRDDSKLLPATRVFRDGGSRYYYGLNWHEPFRVDTQTRTEQDFRPPANLPELSWPWGFTYDPQRNRVLLSSFGGEGYLYGYAPNTEQWSVVRSMNNIDVDSLEYHAADDSLYALTVVGGDCGSPFVKKFTPDGQLQSEFPLPLQAYGLSLGRHTTELVSVGEYLVLLLEPMHFSSYEENESRMYLIDPRTRQSWLTYRGGNTSPNQAPQAAITQPANGTEFPLNTPIDITVEARDPDGYVRTVEFFADGRKTGEQSVAFVLPPPPGQSQTFTFTWREPTVGSHVLTARAIDDDNASTMSAPVDIHIGPSNSLPTVNVVATDCFAVEPSSNTVLNTATFRIIRSGRTNDWLPVTFSLHGTAQPGVDYEHVTAGVTIPPGQESVTVTVRPLADNLTEGLETVILQLEDPPPVGPTVEVRPPEYRVGSRRRAAVLISDTPAVLAAKTTRWTRLSDGALHLCFGVSTGDDFRVEATADFRIWEPVFAAAAEGGVLHFVEDNTTVYPYRFYRVVPQSIVPGQ